MTEEAKKVVLKGEVEKLIELETSLEQAYIYFSDFHNVLSLLPGVERILHFKDGRYRLIMPVDDGRGHEAGLVFDVRAEHAPQHAVKARPLLLTPEKLSAEGVKHKDLELFFPGQFEGGFSFHNRNNRIEILYEVKLLVELEVPHYLNFIPLKVLQTIGDGLMQKKLKQTADRFIENIKTDFQHYLLKGLAPSAAYL